MTPELSTLSFAIETERLVDEEGEVSRPYRSVDVRLLVNGKQPTTQYTFDILNVIGYGARSCDIDLYTCSCGVAGCAGIHDAVQVLAEGEVVTWLFPEKPFRTQFDPALFPAEQPLLVRFARTQYLQAIADIEAQLFELTMTSEEPLVLSPYTYPKFDLVIGESIAGAKEWADSRLANIAWLKKLFQHLYDMELLVEWPNGAQQRVSVVTLAQELAYRKAESLKLDPESEDEERHVILENEIAPAMVASNEALFDLARSIPWKETTGILWRTGTSRNKPPASGWETATLSLRTEQ